MEWLGRAKVAFTHARETRVLPNRDGTEADLASICRDATPPCSLNPLLFNGHLQTMWTATKDEGPPVWYRRKVFDAELESKRGTFAVDFVTAPHEVVDEALPPRTRYLTDDEFANLGSLDFRPMLVVLHGLAGGSDETYLRHCIKPLVDAGKWDICIVNSRGCAKTKITTGVLYNARATWDVRQTVKWCRETFPNRPLFALGFSLGANILTNYCGEEGPNCLLKGAVVCSNPFNLEVCSKMLQNTLIGKHLYLRVMASSMKQLVKNHEAEFAKYTKVDVDRVANNVTYLYEFDREVQCPTWGYPTEYAYYRDASSTDSVLGIEIPFLAVQAQDDPIAVNEGLPYEEFQQNPNTIMLTTSMGGHLCWFEWGGSRWYPKPICNFLNHLAFKVDLDNVSPEGTSASPYHAMRRRMSGYQ